MRERSTPPWLIGALGVLCAGAILAAILLVGPASPSQASVTRTATVASGVVQSTVSGSGNLQPISQLDLGFKTSGTVTRINVRQGQYVTEGQLIAELDPESAEVTLEQSRAALQAAEANLAKEEETGGEGSSGSGAGGASAAAAAAAHSNGAGDGTSEGTQTAPSTSKQQAAEITGSSASESAGANAGSGASQTTLSPATREANLASARAQVRSDALTVQGDEQAVQDTKLYAPENGTIVSLAGQVGEVVSASGTTRSSSAGASGESSAATTTGTSGGSRSGGAAASSSSGSSSTSSSAFAVLSDLSAMDLVVPLSESEIGSVRKGQIATVTVEALDGRKLAAHVREVAILSSSNSGVVSYDVTFELDQMTAGLRPGMSASAEVVIKQAEGVNVPTSAITAGGVTVVRGGAHVRQPVTTGLAGNSSTIILSGLHPGETVVLPTLSTSSAGGSTLNRLSRLAGAGRLGGAGGLGAAGGLGGAGAAGGAPTFLRGGG